MDCQGPLVSVNKDPLEAMALGNLSRGDDGLIVTPGKQFQLRKAHAAGHAAQDFADFERFIDGGRGAADAVGRLL